MTRSLQDTAAVDVLGLIGILGHSSARRDTKARPDEPAVPKVPVGTP